MYSVSSALSSMRSFDSSPSLAREVESLYHQKEFYTHSADPEGGVFYFSYKAKEKVESLLPRFREFSREEVEKIFCAASDNLHLPAIRALMALNSFKEISVDCLLTALSSAISRYFSNRDCSWWGQSWFTDYETIAKLLLDTILSREITHSQFVELLRNFPIELKGLESQREQILTHPLASTPEGAEEIFACFALRGKTLRENIREDNGSITREQNGTIRTLSVYNEALVYQLPLAIRAGTIKRRILSVSDRQSEQEVCSFLDRPSLSCIPAKDLGEALLLAVSNDYLDICAVLVRYVNFDKISKEDFQKAFNKVMGWGEGKESKEAFVKHRHFSEVFKQEGFKLLLKTALEKTRADNYEVLATHPLFQELSPRELIDFFQRAVELTKRETPLKSVFQSLSSHPNFYKISPEDFTELALHAFRELCEEACEALVAHPSFQELSTETLLTILEEHSHSKDPRAPRIQNLIKVPAFFKIDQNSFEPLFERRIKDNHRMVLILTVYPHFQQISIQTLCQFLGELKMLDSYSQHLHEYLTKTILKRNDLPTLSLQEIRILMKKGWSKPSYVFSPFRSLTNHPLFKEFLAGDLVLLLSRLRTKDHGFSEQFNSESFEKVLNHPNFSQIPLKTLEKLLTMIVQTKDFPSLRSLMAHSRAQEYRPEFLKEVKKSASREQVKIIETYRSACCVIV